MAIPRKLKMMNLLNEGNSYMGQVAEVTLPKLSQKLENWRGGGMMGNVKIDMGHNDDMNDLSWKLGGLDPLVLKQFGASKVDAYGLRFAGSYQRDDTGETTPVEIVVRGRHEEIDMGSAKPGDATEHSIKTIWTYYKLIVDGQETIEIDIPNCIFKVDGVDKYAEHRKNIGL